MKKTFFTGLFVMGATMLLVNCGSSGGGSSSTTATTPVGVMTTMGCVQTCGSNMGLVNGQCVAVQITGGACTVGQFGTGQQQICPANGYIQTMYGQMQQCVPGQMVTLPGQTYPGTTYPGQMYPGGGYYPQQYQSYPYYWNTGGYYYYYPRW